MTTTDAPRPVTPAPEAALTAYAPERPACDTDLWLAGNEGAPPDPALLARLGELTPEDLRRYPDASALEARLAASLGLPPEQVLVTAGADEALDRVCRAWLGPDRPLLVPTPTFEMLLRYAAQADAPVDAVPYEGDAYPVDGVLERLRAAAAAGTPPAVVAVVSPNNPTGGVATADDLARLAAAAPEAVLLVDQAYGEYADDDLTAATLALPNALLVRTFSKAWGLAGLRVGWVAGPRPLVDALRRVGGPFPVSSVSLALADRRLEQADDMRAGVARVCRNRDRLLGRLRSLGFTPRASAANFVYLPTPRARALRDALASLGITVRLFESPETAVRLGVPADQADLERLLEALATIARPEALLLDVDGVLADVSRSYRQAILETARGFGVELTPADVAEAKRAGDANDDWELTRRLLARRGVDLPLGQVRARFEALYQGTDERPGLRRHERALVPAQELAELAARLAAGVAGPGAGPEAAPLPVALVTGRPRGDALRFVEEAGLGDLVDLVVAREDAAATKPDPAPVRAALEGLGVDRAWMVGDTPDDVVAARRAGVLPLGVLAPGDDEAVGAATLRRAGAAEVARRMPELSLLRAPLTAAPTARQPDPQTAPSPEAQP